MVKVVSPSSSLGIVILLHVIFNCPYTPCLCFIILILPSRSNPFGLLIIFSSSRCSCITYHTFILTVCIHIKVLSIVFTFMHAMQHKILGDFSFLFLQPPSLATGLSLIQSLLRIFKFHAKQRTYDHKGFFSFLFYAKRHKVFYNLYFSHNLTYWQLWILLWKLLCFYFIIYVFVLARRLKPCMYIFVDKPNFLFFSQFAFLLCQNYNSIFRTYCFFWALSSLSCMWVFDVKRRISFITKAMGKGLKPVMRWLLGIYMNY